MHRNARRCVQCDCGPHHVDIILGDTVGLQEVARSVRAVNLEALGPAAMLTYQSHVVKHCARVKQLSVKEQAAPPTSQTRLE